MEFDLPAEMTVRVYRDGEIDESAAMGRDNPAVTAVGAWLASHPTGWERDWNSYAPGFRLQAEKINVVLLADGSAIVVNMQQEDGDWIQVSQEVPEADRRRLLASFGD